MQISCFVVGNCQGQFLSSALASLPGWETYAMGRRFGFDPVIGGQKPQYAPHKDFWPLVQEAKKVGRYCLVLEQVTPMAPPRGWGVREKLIDRKVYFPHVQSQALWPGRFIKPEILSQTSAKRMVAQDLANLKKVQVKADFPVNLRDFVAERAAVEPLFHTWGHPTGGLLSLILGGILQQLQDIIPPDRGQALVEMIAASRGIDNNTGHPIDRAWLREAGYEWGDSPAYAGWSDAVALFRSGDTTEAVQRARDSISADASNAHVWGLLGQALDRLKSPTEAEAAFRTAIELQPRASNLRMAFGRFLLKNGMAHRAVHVGRAACEIFPSDTPSHLLLADAHFALGEMDEGRAAISAGVARAKAHSVTYVRMLESLIRLDQREFARETRAAMLHRLPEDPALVAFAA